MGVGEGTGVGAGLVSGVRLTAFFGATTLVVFLAAGRGALLCVNAGEAIKSVAQQKARLSLNGFFIISLDF